MEPGFNLYASSLTYQLSCATIYFTNPYSAVVRTSTGFEIQLTALGNYARYSTVSVGQPSYAVNSTAGLLGSWDGNVTNDLTDASGHDWLQTYPGDVNTAAFAFGQTWAVPLNQSFFINVGPPQLTCNHTDLGVPATFSSALSVSCLFSPTTSTNLLNYTGGLPLPVNHTARPQPTVPDVWPDTTLQQSAIATCEAGLGIFDVTNVLVQNCLLDVYATNTTQAASSSIMNQAQQLVQSVVLPSITVLLNTPAMVTLQIDASLALVTQGGLCTSLSVTPITDVPHPGSNVTQCAYVFELGNTGTAGFTPIVLSSVVTAVSPDFAHLNVSLPGLAASTTLNVRVALLVYTAATGTNGTQTSYATTAVLSVVTAPIGQSSTGGAGSSSSSAAVTAPSTAESSSSLPSSLSSSSASLSSSPSSASSSSASPSASSAPTSASTPVASSSTGQSAGVLGDPQFVGLRGQRYQVHGIDGAIYSLISEPAMQLNARFRFLTGPRPCPVMPSTGLLCEACWSHDGSYLGEVAALVKATGEAVRVVAGNATHGFASVEVNGARLTVGQSTPTSTVELLSTHELVLVAGSFRVVMESVDGFVNLRRVELTVPFAQLRSHGLLGQTWSSARHQSTLKVIEGEVDDYVLADDDMFGTDFPFNQFEAAQQ